MFFVPLAFLAIEYIFYLPAGSARLDFVGPSAASAGIGLMLSQIGHKRETMFGKSYREIVEALALDVEALTEKHLKDRDQSAIVLVFFLFCIPLWMLSIHLAMNHSLTRDPGPPWHIIVGALVYGIGIGLSLWKEGF